MQLTEGMHGIWTAQQRAQLLQLRGQDTAHKRLLRVMCGVTFLLVVQAHQEQKQKFEWC